MKILRKISITFFAGCLGGLVNSFAVWLFGELKISYHLGVAIGGKMSGIWFHPRIVWGGLWGLLFLLPVLKNRYYLKGALLSLLPSLNMFFLVFPYDNKGIFGLVLGPLTPLLVIFYNLIWGLVAAWWLKLSRFDEI